MPLPALPEPAHLGDRLWGAVRALPLLVALGASLLFFNGLQATTLVARPFSKRVFRRTNRELADLWWGWCVKAGRRFLRVSPINSGDNPPTDENAMVIANHQQITDVAFLMFLAEARGRLGDMKWFVKAPVKWVPGVGWGMQFLDCIFVKRDWARDAGTVERTFSRIVREKIPIWLMSFSEGTRLTSKKLLAAQCFAKERGQPVLRNVLVPRTKGFAASVQGLRGHLDAIYDVTIGYVDGVPTLWQYIRGMVRTAHMHVRRFPMSELPESPEALADWLLSRFAEKDRLLDVFYRDGAFPAEPLAD
jgi:1-acyl-sn-glycerol-3-phosphate acyltransferase